MKHAAKKETVRQEAPTGIKTVPGMQGRLPLVLAAVQEEFFSVVMSLGTNVFAAMLEDERTRLCGTRYAHDAERNNMRAGYTDGELAMGGQRVSILSARS